MKNNSFILNTYRYDYLKKLRSSGYKNPYSPPHDRRIRFCQPEPACCLCARKPFVLHMPPDHAALSGIQAQLSSADGTTIANSAPVLFNAIVTNPSPDLEYNGATGEFIIRKPGNYYVSWWVNTDGAGLATFAMFSVSVANGQIISASSSTLVLTSQLNGSALLTINEAIVPARVRLLNTSGDTVTYGITAIQANMDIVEITIERHDHRLSRWLE